MPALDIKEDQRKVLLIFRMCFMAGEGRTADEIGEACILPPTTVRRILNGVGIKLFEGSAGARRLPITLMPSSRRALDKEAERRLTDPEKLAAKIVSIVARDNMWAGILEDGRR